MEDGIGGRIYAMGPRVPLIKARDTPEMGTITVGSSIPSRTLFGRAAATTTECLQANLCEKPVGGSSMTVAIALGVAIPVAAAISVLLYLHRRNVKKQRREDLMDPHKSLDFGLGDHPGGASKVKRKSFLGREKDQSRFQRQQLSMDMNLSSPYLLPPEVHGSRESLNSLARTLNEHEDPYRPIKHFAGSDAGSIRSMQPRGGADGASVYTRPTSRQESTRRQSRPLASPGPGPGSYLPRQNSIPRSPLMPPEPMHFRPQQQQVPEESVLPNHSGNPFVLEDEPPMPSPRRVDSDTMPAIQEPLAVAQKTFRNPMLSSSQPSPADSGVDIGYGDSSFTKPQTQEAHGPMEPTLTGLGLVNHPEPMQATIHMTTPVFEKNAPAPHPPRGQSATGPAPVIEEPLEYFDYDYPEETPEVRMPQQPVEDDDDFDERRGRTMQRQSHLHGQTSPSSLGVPQQQDNRRLSVGFRPLPPAEITESEDPEYRANRIRSFYKEYFDDGKGENAPPVPQLPPMARNQNPGGYYEDYDENYMGDATYFDPETNAFVMPYAQPISRRAMTPPPTSQRFAGPRPPRAFNGSLAGMKMPPPPGGGPRPGSSASSRPGPGLGSFRPPQNRSRAGSVASGSRHGAPRKPMPPPAALNTMPNPSKLKDDSFAIFNSIDFAPPENFADRTRGRSQSPAGERRPYQVNVPAHSPLANAFEELPSLPSPHLLRKSSTFTGLDFAPPRKFAESDSRSETGSIRSNRSGISAVQLGAIRSGAGRVSRLPGDQVFTAHALQETLKPSWGLRDT
ncbi:hypothetical protein B0T17DRAFT_502530 [Bombardia bombarda]|uniref:Uncharacterized protein n=1 Tax=Bombardia bombarda TaxID=252184 RepID=A0AA39XJ28_9PEZI|nr:hypothetical protein B0T17DRAFT_502530 [Bombardia bombarda]